LEEVERPWWWTGRPMAPVMEDGNLVGVITHTDLLQSLLDQPMVPGASPALNAGLSGQGARHKNLGGLIASACPRRWWRS
jgi:predicted transcriptional regulator